MSHTHTLAQVDDGFGSSVQDSPFTVLRRYSSGALGHDGRCSRVRARFQARRSLKQTRACAILGSRYLRAIQARLALMIALVTRPLLMGRNFRPLGQTTIPAHVDRADRSISLPINKCTFRVV